MKDYTLSELRRISEAYMMVSEALARPNSYKNLAPEQAELLAKLSPSYKSNQIWGQTSNWICSTANRLIKYRNMPFDDVYRLAQNAAQDIADYEKFAKKIKRNIDTIKTFDELKSVMDEMRNTGAAQSGLSQSAKRDGRARQCYSLMKNGGDDFTVVYEDGRWIVGYPNGFDYNSKFSSIGKWCHTGSFGDGRYYWGEYADSPVFYILDKQHGYVLCASYPRREIRNQDDNWPDGSRGNWDNFFDSLGLRSPMVDNINAIIDGYVVPEDELGPQDVWDRIDFHLVQEYLFADSEFLDLDNDDYGRGGGDFHFRMPTEMLSPKYGSDDALYTKYAADVDATAYYTFDEFEENAKICYDNSDNNNDAILMYILNNVKCFRELWNTARDMPSLSYSSAKLEDEHTMSERMTINDLYKIYRGEDVRFGFDSRRKQQSIIDQLNILIKNYKKLLLRNFNNAIPSKYGYVSFYNDYDTKKMVISIDIDADEAESLASRVQNGEISFGENQNIDILTLELDGKESFAVNRITEDELYTIVYNCIQYIKWICKTPKDLDGQIHFEFGMFRPHYFDDDGYEIYGYNYPTVDSN